jgi:hypothetical protein
MIRISINLNQSTQQSISSAIATSAYQGNVDRSQFSIVQQRDCVVLVPSIQIQDLQDICKIVLYCCQIIIYARHGHTE